MVRLILVMAAFALVACGDAETGQTGSAPEAEAPAVSATAPRAATAPRSAEAPVSAVAPGTTDVNVQRCLDLVAQSRFAGALPVCLQALQADPDNADVQAAVERARAEAQGAVTGAAGGALQKATSAAQGALPQALPSVEGMPAGAANPLEKATGTIPGRPTE